MKKYVDSFLFIIRMAYKNIIFSKFKAFILFLTFTILVFLSIVTFTSKTFLTEYYRNEQIERYGDIDFFLTIDENTNARYFSIRELMNQVDIEAEFNILIPTFEMSSVMELEDSTLNYVDVIAANLSDFKKIVSNTKHHSIHANEIMITSTLSETYSLKMNDTIYLKIGSEKIPFTIIDIIPDQGLFSENHVYIDKDQNISYLLKSFGLDLNPVFTKNIYNHVYFSLNDESKLNEIRKTILDIPDYQKALIVETMNEDLIEEAVMMVASLFFVILTFILFAVVLVLQSTLLIIFEERKAQIGVIQILGGRLRFSRFVIVTEIVIYLMFSFLIGSILSHYIFNNGLDYMGSTLSFSIPINNLILSFVFILFLSAFIIVYNFLKIKRISLIKLSLSTKIIPSTKPFSIVVILVLCILFYGINNFLIPLNREWNSLVNIMIGMLFMFNFAPLLLIFTKWLIEKRFKKTSLFSLFTVKNFNDHSLQKPVVYLLLTSILIIVMLVGANGYMHYRLNTLQEMVKVDFGITNVINHFDQTYNTLKNDELVKEVDVGYFYRNVKVEELNTYFLFSLSVDPNHLTEYLKMDIKPTLHEQMTHPNRPTILLPIKYHYLNHIEVGDTIHLFLSQEHPNEEFVVGGFMEEGFNEILITNIVVLEKYHDLRPNTILINYHDSVDITKQDLIEKFSSELYYVIDFNEMMTTQIQKNTNLTEYISYIIIVMVISFMLTIFNHLAIEFTKMKPVYSRLRVLGCSMRRLMMTIILEKLIILWISILTISVALWLVIKHLPNILLFYGTYEQFFISSNTFMSAILIITLIYLISTVYYLYKVKNINITDVLKYY